MSTIIPIKAFNDNYIWMVINEQKRIALCIDPGDASPVIDYLSSMSLNLKAILLTHHHYDHTNGVNELLRYAKSQQPTVYGPKDDRLQSLVTQTVEAGEIIAIPALIEDIKVLFTPGHTSSHICFYSHTLGSLFCGDTLFSAGCGRLFEGSYQQLYDSLNQLKALPNETLVYCAHEYTKANLDFALSVEPENEAIQAHINKISQQTLTLPSSIALEKNINPFFRADKIRLETELNAPALSPFDRFCALRRLKDSF